MDKEITDYIRQEMPLVADSLIKNLKVSILGNSELVPDSQIPIGASKFYGKPDTPNDFEWPMTKDGPCWFLGQLNIEDCKKFKTKIELPESGLLSFFYHDAGGPAGKESKIFYFSTNDLERKEIVKDKRWGDHFHEEHHQSRLIKLKQGYSLPEKKYKQLHEEEKLYEDLYDFIDEFNDYYNDGVHYFFGLSNYMWEDPPENHEIIASFGECHDRVHYFAPKDELWNFKNIKVIYSCT